MGSGRLLVISGEAGLGKTTLGAEVGRMASARGFRVVAGGCHDGDDSPYGPFVELIEGLYRSMTPTVFADVLGSGGGDLARFMPELRRWVPTLSQPVVVPPEHERRLVFSAVVDALHRLATVSPVVALVEDLQWADSASLMLLTHILPRLTLTPTLIVATRRAEESGTATPLGDLVEQWRASTFVEELVLRGLDRNEVGEMVTDLAGSRPPHGVVTRWHELTGGNPFLVTEVFRHLSSQQALFGADGSWLELSGDTDLPVPPAVRRVTELRVRSLRSGTQEVLEALAVAGRATVEVIAETVTMTVDVVVEALDEAHRVALISSTTGCDSPAEFGFAHELIRLAVLVGVTPARRQRLHASIARVIEDHDDGHPGLRAGELVHHLCRAGPSVDRETLVIHLEAAATQAERGAAFEDAVAHLDRALALVGQHPDVRARLLGRRARVLCGLGRWDEAQAAWQQAVLLLGQVQDVEAMGALCAQAAGNLFWAGRYDQCVTAVRTGLAALGGRASADRSRLLALGGKCATFAGDGDAGERLTAEALLVAGASGDRSARASAGFARTVHHWSIVEPASAVAYASEAAADARAAGALWDLADGLGFAQLAHVLAGEVEAVAALGTELDVLVGQLGHYGAAFMRGRARVLQEITLGDLHAVAAAAQADLDQCRVLGLPWIADSHAWLGLAAFWAGDWDRAGDLYERGIAEDPTGTLSGACWATTFLLRAHRGDDRGCRQMLRDHADHLPIDRRTAGLGEWTSLLAATEGLVLLGHRQDAARHYPAVLRALDAGNVLRGYDNRLVETVAGLAADASGDRERSDAHFSTALRQARTIPVRLEQPETRRLYAWTLLGRGDPADRALAIDLLDEAASGYRTLGMPRHEAMAGDLRSRATADHATGGLTARERDVLVELAAGRTSKEIARTLSISVATVNRHVANLYAKIDARNRTEATRWALRRGLVRSDAETP